MATPLEELHELYGDWADGDFARIDIFHPDVVSRMVGWIDLDSEVRGTDQLVELMRTWLSAWERPHVVEADEFIESGDRILVLIRWRGCGKGSGAETEGEGAHLWTFREGLAVQWNVYRNREEAREALDAGD